MDLYLDKSKTKTAAGYIARMSEQTENWPQEVTSEMYKQLPYISDYEVHVGIDRLDPQRGFGFGYADISNKTERPEVEHEEAGLPHIRIPIIIEDRALKPLSTFLDGDAVRPLNEDRIREALFQPATFDLSVQEPKDPSLVNDMMPPQRSGFGYGEVKTAGVRRKAVKEVIETFVPEANVRRAAKWAGGLGVAGGGAVGFAAGRVSKKEKTAFQHISKPQWEALYQNPKVLKIVEKHGTNQHPEVQNQVYELAAQIYGYHPKNGGYAPTNPQAQQPAPKPQGGEQQKAPSAPADEGQQKQASLLLAIAPTVHQRDLDAFTEKVASDPNLIAGLRRSGIVPTLVEFSQTKRASAQDHLLALAERVEPNVVTLQRLPGGEFLVKSANTDAFAGGPAAQGEVVPEAEAAEAIGPENAQAMLPGQTVTVNSNPAQAPAEPAPSRARPIEEFGQYKVQDMMGNSLMGHVFPQTLSWDGEFSPQPIALFTNGAAYAFQDAVVGELVGKGTNLPVDQPRGDGVFYKVEGGEPICTGPVTIGSSMAGPDGLPRFTATDPFGSQFQVSFMDGLKTPQRISDAEYALPGDWKFMRLNNQTQLVTDPSQMGKTASVRSLRGQATLFFNGAYQLQGECGLDKIASSLRYDMDPVHAEFMLAVLGLDGVAAKQKVAEARRKGEVKLAGLKTITTLGERHQEAVKTASAFLRELPNLRRDLVKEAADLEDTATVDNVLALNFLNSENLPAFVGYLPELEETSERLSEMLLYSQMGQNELPEESLERTMRNMEEVVRGLKSIAHAEA